MNAGKRTPTADAFYQDGGLAFASLSAVISIAFQECNLKLISTDDFVYGY